jgi:hypothetical protein
MSVALTSLIVSMLAASAPTDVYSVIGDRPMSKAVDIIERMCRCVITYEDPRYDDFAGDDRRSFTFKLVSRRDQRDLQPTLQALVDAFGHSGNPGRFRVYAAADGYRVVPQDAFGSLLETHVTTKAMRGTALDALKAFVKSLTAAARTNVLLGAVPEKLLTKSTVGVKPQTAEADAILADILHDTGHRLSWRLHYDRTGQRYVLNLHAVD